MTSFERFDQSKHFPIQTELHGPIPLDGRDTVELISYFDQSLIKTAWKYIFSTRLEPAISGDEIFVIIKNSADYLLQTRIVQVLPEIKVKSDLLGTVRFAWCRHAAHHLFKKSMFIIDGVEKYSYDEHFYDIIFNYYAKNRKGWRRTYLRTIGSIPDMEDWHTSTPEMTIDIPQPFFYSRDDTRALPLFRISNNVISQKWIRRLRVDELIRVQQKVDDTWNDVEFNPDLFDIWRKEFSPPEIFGDFANITDDERSRILGKPDQRWFVEGLTSIEVKSGVPFSLDISNPIRSIFIVINDKDLSIYKEYSIYTVGGKGRLAWTTIKSFGKTAINLLDDSFISYSRDSFESCPVDLGIYGYSFIRDHLSVQPESGPIFDQSGKSTIEVTLKDSSVDSRIYVYFLTNDIWEFNSTNLRVKIQPKK